VERHQRTIGEEALDRMDWGLPDEGPQRHLQRWREEYNRVRPHEAAERWWPSEQRRPAEIPAMAYPAGSAVRMVQGRGEISWRGYELSVGQGMEGEPVRVEEKDGEVEVWYGLRRLRALPVVALVKGRFN